MKTNMADEMVAQFLAAKLAEGLAARTLRNYQQHLHRYADFCAEGQMDWQSAAAARAFVAAVAAGASGRGAGGAVAVATVRAYYRSLRVWWRWLVAEGLAAKNPMSRIKMPRADQALPKSILVDDFWALLREARASRRDYAIVLMLADTGIRDAELRGLRLSDLDLGQRRAVVLGKGRKMRTIFLTEETAQAVAGWLRERPEETPFVFPSRQGRQMAAGTVHQLLHRLAERAGIAGRYNPHAFRHFFASAYVAAGGDLETLRRMLGHSDLETTRQYLHFDQAILQSRHDALSPVALLAPTEQLALFDW